MPLPVDFYIILLATIGLKFEFFKKRQQVARLKNLNMHALQTKTGLGEMEEVFQHGKPNSLSPVRRIDDQIERAVMGDFPVGH